MPDAAPPSPPASPPGTPLFVLVRPQLGENIGASARAMWNFGLDRMALVAPRDGWPNPRAIALASGAGRVLDAAAVVDATPEAVGQAHWVLATTARERDMTKPVYDPEAAMAEARARIGGGERVAVLFGPERAGLENDDVARAHAIVSVPANPAFPSLNLAQCVLLMAYEWRRAAGGTGAVTVEMAGTRSATEQERAALVAHWEERLEEAGFFFPPARAAAMRLALRNLWSRLPLTSADVGTLHGAMRQMARWASRGGRGQGDGSEAGGEGSQ